MQMEQPQQRRRRQKQQPRRPCPRCGSDDTKFCYFNNYATSQPRHYCKTCKRYWTHGGALRNIPEGSGCRRQKKAAWKNSAGLFGWGFGSTPAAAMLTVQPGGGRWSPNHYCYYQQQRMNQSCVFSAAAAAPPPASNEKIINGDEWPEGGRSDWEIDELLLAVLSSSFSQL